MNMKNRSLAIFLLAVVSATCIITQANAEAQNPFPAVQKEPVADPNQKMFEQIRLDLKKAVSSVTDSQLDELDAKFTSQPNYYMELAEADRSQIIPVLLAGMKRRPKQMGFMGTLLFKAQVPDVRTIRGLPPEQKKEYYLYELAYLQEALEIFKATPKSDLNPQIEDIPQIILQMQNPMALAAMESGELSLSKQIAEEMLTHNKDPNSWNYGNVISQANTVLGRVALRENDLEKAKDYLIRSGKTPGSPQLNSFGPSFVLARELLEKGQKETVIEYLDLIAVFWANPEKVSPPYKKGTEEKALLLTKWKQEIRDGRIPTDRQWQR
jgi:tetratricopeptide (TPR) repeat protein